ncbi:hypothetical protein OQY15_22130 [Pedobacter sp. MC2016-15]|uniref:hypothetical protein n=1 Tax=Pedobacter sp. MC2016-15 TaxID=2994473 RepID=UPI002245BC28|nr:hypothetical protein [Pedobacter sp. MC2016-15]MCX2481814.1 hypothetical protein [Pedobacter sp. MC2016-15]
MNKFLLPAFLVISLLLSCAKSNNTEVEVYNNDFENGDLQNILNGKISRFNGSSVLGNFNNEGFNLTVNNLPSHEVVEITFDLYIHDSWEGVQSANDQTNGPDIWQMTIDDKLYIYTTFANFDCIPGNFCPPQSYPADYPAQSNNPKTGASRTDLPGFCSQVEKSDGTTLYKIHKKISHSSKQLELNCLDVLKEKYQADPKCDESWSIDNLQIKAVNIR